MQAMAIESENFAAESKRDEQRHPYSAFEEFNRDERRPAVLLLAALLIATLFFTIGLMVGRWMSEDSARTTNAPPTNSVTE